MSVEEVTVSDKAINELLDALEDVAVNNGIGNGKEGFLVLLGLAAGQISAEIEIEHGYEASVTVDNLLDAVRAGIYNSRKSVRSTVPLGESIH